MLDFPEWGVGTGAFRLADEVARLQAVVAVQTELSTVRSDVPALMVLVANRAQEMTGATGAVVETPEGDHLVCVAATGTGEPHRGLRVPIGGSLSGLAFLTGEVLSSDDTKDDLRIDHEKCEQLGMRSTIAVPLGSSDKPFGVLQVLSTSPCAFGPEHLQMLRLLGGFMSARLELAAELDARQSLLAQNAITLAALRESESRFRNAFDDSGIGMALVGRDGRWSKVNATLCRIVGYAEHELLCRELTAIAHPDDRDLDGEPIAHMWSGEISTYEVEKRFLHKDGSLVWMLLTASMVKDTAGQPLYFLLQLQDFTARKVAEDALKSLAVRDALTGLFNRREMDRLLKEEMTRAQRHQRPLSLLMVDIDHFKRVNDTYGHQVGDRAIREVARLVLECVRALDRAARYGGEELAVILPETSDSDAAIVAERIRTRVAAHPLSTTLDENGACIITLTVSVGVSTFVATSNGSVERLIGEADGALYAAKQRGRNCTVLHGARDAGAAEVPVPLRTAS
ncbi:MAG TPA: diguanylate cyclase [Polyangia bacterium]|jgi:diguanylate cyclase (GGDEF)-like protein/PAS domain S-box-containing protein|nr:diguanylate cyclase [Polyangia bacterium]